MGDIYATPESDLSQRPQSDRAGGNVEDAINGNIEINMLETLGEAWRGMKGFKLKCHIASGIWFVIYILAALIPLPVTIGLINLGADITRSTVPVMPLYAVEDALEALRV